MKSLFMVLISVLLLIFVLNINAQETGNGNDIINENVNFLRFYDNEMFHWNFNVFDGLTINYGNNNWKYNIFRTNINNEIIRNALLEYPDSTQEYNSFRKNAINGNILYWSGLVLILSSLIPVITIEDDINLRDGLYYGLFIGGATTSILGIFKFNSAQANIFNAVNMFNRNKAREINR